MSVTIRTTNNSPNCSLKTTKDFGFDHSEPVLGIQIDMFLSLFCGSALTGCLIELIASNMEETRD